MEYIVSARKYRPMTFDSVVGQAALTTTLKNAVINGKLAHAYLFCGPRGVGKTTCARIFAKVINCQSPTSTGDACGECESCKAFEEGRSLNIFELDAASNNGVDQIKSLMEQTRIPPQTGKYKVFIIDEVHMLSPAAFNAFLKTLEEPPAHVIFILATTEKHKILPTIISRCQIYDFERMSVQNIIMHLKKLADREGYTYEEQALNLIAEKADGGMRDALSIFDQVASFCQGNITYQKVLEDLNILDTDYYFKLTDLSLENKVSEVLLTMNDLLSKGFDAGMMVNGFASHLRNVLMALDNGTTKLIETSDQMRQRYAEQAKRCKPKFLYSALKILNQCDVNYRQSSNKRLLAELTLIQVAQITQEEDSDSVGRGPCKRLKFLFKKLTGGTQQTKAAQVAKAGNGHPSTPSVSVSDNAAGIQATSNATVNLREALGRSNSQQPTNPTPISKTEGRQPKIKLTALGSSFRNRIAEKKEDKNEENLFEDLNIKEDEIFTEDDLRREWLSMCNRMMLSTEFKTLAKRMLNVQLKISECPKVECLAENNLLIEDINKIYPRIKATLAKNLHNGSLELSLRLAEQHEVKRRLTPREVFAEMAEKNSSFATFKNILKLEVE